MLAAMLFAAQAAVSPLTFPQAKARADANENSLSATTHAALLDAQGKALKTAVAACARPAPDLSAFTVVLSLHADGSVASSWFKGHTAFARCVRTQLVSHGVPGHWDTPFFTSFEVSFNGQ
jgi:hypothetical protein